MTGCPSWANGGQAGNVPPTNASDFADFCLYLAGRYPQLAALEVWNEPDLDGSWATSTGTIAQRTAKYVAILAATYVALKAARPALKVLAPCIANATSTAWLGGFLAAGGVGYYDVFSAHIYGDPPDHGSLTPRQLVASWASGVGTTLALYGEGAREVWLTEFGWNTAASGVSEAQQASNLTAVYAAIRELIPNCTRAFWYQYFNQIEGSAVGNDNYGLTHLDFTPKPALAAFRSLP